MLVPANSACMGLLTLLAFSAVVVEIFTRSDTSKLYYLDELYGNELVFRVLSFVSSINTGVETTEQFFPLHTR